MGICPSTYLGYGVIIDRQHAASHTPDLASLRKNLRTSVESIFGMILVTFRLIGGIPGSTEKRKRASYTLK